MRAVHIGFPKTATTFLQTRVFPKLTIRGFTYWGKAASARFFESLIDDDETVFDAASTREELAHAAATGKMLLSYEGLTGAHYRSGFVNRTQIARRLKTVGFDRALITIRNQFEALESSYKQYVKSGGVLRFGDYVTFDPSKPRYLDPRYFDYHLIYECYAGLFGPENVLVLQYEDVGKKSFLDSLTAFLDAGPIEVEPAVPTNPSLSYRKTAILRVANHFTYSSFHPSSLLSRRLSTSMLHRALARLPPGNDNRSFLDDATRRSVREAYSASNRRLGETAGIALAPSYP